MFNVNSKLCASSGTVSLFMGLQCKRSDKRFIAVATFMWFAIFMEFHVHSEISTLADTLSTQSANLFPQLVVRQSVLLQR